MRILGIDPGSRFCGYGVVDVRGNSLGYVECGVIAPRAAAPLAERLAEIFAELSQVICELSPTVVAVENVFFAENPQSALRLGHARGVALAAAGRAGLLVYEYAPAMIKRTVAGSGRAGKAQIGQMVRALFRLRRAPAVDASDALAVAVTHARSAPIAVRSGGARLA